MRYPSIDLLRMLAIFLMVLVHFVENLSGSKPYPWLPAGFAAPIFTFLTGLSYRLWLHSQHSRGAAESEITHRTIRRGLFLTGVGFAFNILVWMPEDVFNWDVLTFVGAAWIFLGMIRNLPEVVVLVIGVALSAVAPALRVAADYPAYWTNGYFDPDLNLTDVVLGFLVTGYFPFVPWILFPLLGSLVGERLLNGALESEGALLRLGGCGAALLTFGLVLLRLQERLPASLFTALKSDWTMFPPSPIYLATTVGSTLVLFACGRRWLDNNPHFQRNGHLAHCASTFSRHAFTMYILHHICHLWPLWVYGVWAGHDATYYWQKALPVWVSLPLACGFLYGSYQLLRFMDRRDIPGMETVMRRLCD